MKKVTVGIVGSGFAAAIHAESYRQICGLDVNVKAVASVDPKVGDFAKHHGIPVATADYQDLLKDKEIDIVDIVTPPALHYPMILESLKAGKHVICEKPLLGYFGLPEDKTPIGFNVSKQKMYDWSMEKVQELRDAVQKSGCLFMYAENFVYAPAVQRSVEMIRARKSTCMLIRAEECHSGSHAPHAGRWDQTGGGVLMRMACHPLTGALYVKYEDARARGVNVRPVRVMAQTNRVVERMEKEKIDLTHIAARPYDVEDWAKMIVTFSDGTVADICCSDFSLGGTINALQMYTNNCVLFANMNPNNGTMGFFPDDKGLENVYIAEKVETKTGYQYIYTTENIEKGYVGELQDFAECAAHGRDPVCGIDLAADTVQLIYAGYISAEEGRAVEL